MRKAILWWVLSWIKLEDIVWLIKKFMRKTGAKEIEMRDICPNEKLKGKIYYTIKKKES